MPKPNQLPRLQYKTQDPVFDQWLLQLTDTVNTLAGFNGPIALSDHLDMQNNKVMNLGVPSAATDAISSGHAATLYSASVLAPQLESSGQSSLKSFRQMNNQTQREVKSSFLNDLMSSPPTANNLFPSLTNSGGSVVVSIPPGLFLWSDGHVTNTMGRTDTLSPPAQFAISSISCVGNLVTVNCAATGLAAGSIMTITGVTPSSFNGDFTILSSSGGGSVLTYQDDLGTLTGSGGFVQTNGVFYYGLKKRRSDLTLYSVTGADTLLNRIQANYDGSQIVVVAVVTNSGGSVSRSGGGGSPITGSPTAGSFF